jgi:hypothetical protein
MVMCGDKFAGVTWDPWWRERKSGVRRKKQQRTISERRSRDKTGHRLSPEESVQALRLVHDRRANLRRRNGSDRRKSASRERLIGLAAFIGELGKSVLSGENARLLIRVCAALTTRETYEGWIETSGLVPFFKELDWDARENHEKFRVYAVASFLELLRPRSICWRGKVPARTT